MTRFFACIQKNVKNVFRNWASLFLVIVGPLLLLSIVFLAFSDVGFHNIALGYIASPNSSIDSFVDRISYVGSFSQFDSVEACTEQLKRQKLHGCLEFTRDGERLSINLYSDNARDLISYIIYGQLRRAVIDVREETVEARVQESVTDVKSAVDFLDDTQEGINEVGSELSVQKRELSAVGMQLSDIDRTLSQKKVMLADQRNELQQKRNEVGTDARDLYLEAIEVSSTVKSSIDQVYVAVAPVQDQIALPAKYLIIGQVEQAQSQIDQQYDDVQKELREVDNVLYEMDRSIAEIEEARRFIGATQTKLNTVLRQMDKKQFELGELSLQMEAHEGVLGKVATLNPDMLARPIDILFSPIFKGSERLKNLNVSGEFTEQQKAQLLNFGSVQTLVPFILSILVCFVATILGTIITLDEVHSPAFMRNLIAPVSSFTHTSALFVTVVGVTMIQVCIILGISYVVFFLDILRNFHTIMAALFMLVATYTLMGMIIGYLVRSQSTSLLVSAFVLMITLFMSGTIYPVERMAPAMEFIAQMVPFTAGVSMLQQAIFYSIPFGSLAKQFAILLAIFIANCVILFVVKKLFLRRVLRSG